MSVHKKHKFDVPIAWVEYLDEEYLDTDIHRTVRKVTRLRCDCGKVLDLAPKA